MEQAPLLNLEMIGILSRNNNLKYFYNQEYNPINIYFLRPSSVLFHLCSYQKERKKHFIYINETLSTFIFDNVITDVELFFNLTILYSEYLRKKQIKNNLDYILYTYRCTTVKPLRNKNMLSMYNLSPYYVFISYLQFHSS